MQSESPSFHIGAVNAVSSVLLALLISSASLAGPGRWTSSGPEGGEVSGLVASPDIPGTYWAVSPGGVFKTVDGGVTWVEANAGINRSLGGILHSRTAPGRLHVFGNNKVFFSNNGAVSWNDRTPPAAVLTAGIFTAELSPTTAGRVYVGLADGSVIRSDDAGLNWITTTPIPQPGPFFITAIASHPMTIGELLVATADNSGGGDQRLWRGTAGGAAWAEVPCPVGCLWEDVPLADLEFAAAGGAVWGVNNLGATRSADFGATWTVTGGPSGGQRLAISPTASGQVYVSGRVGLAYTLDNGASWTQVLGGFAGNALLHPAESTVVVYNPFDTTLQLAGSRSNGVYRRTSTVGDFFQAGVDGFNAANIRSVDTTLGDRVHAAIGDAFSPTFTNFRSTNNALTWSPANGGLEADSLRNIAVDPNDTSVVYAVGIFLPKSDNSGTPVPANGGVYKSIDGGVTWSTIDNGIPAPGSPFQRSPMGTVRAIAIDETSSAGGASQTLMIGGSGRLSPDGSGGFNTVAARIYKSTDAGLNWFASDTGIGGAQFLSGVNFTFASVVQILQDSSDATGNTFYATTFLSGFGPSDVPTIDNGVFKSTDGGANWNLASTGLPRIGGNPVAAHENVLSLAIDPTDPTGGTLYASTNDFSNSLVGTVYKTTDGGASWTFSGSGLIGRDVRDLVVDGLTGDVYAAVTDPLGNGDDGVFLSQDGGASWNSISTGFPNSAIVTKLALDNTGSELIIQAGTSRGVQSFTVEPDEDTDGAPDAVEGAAPNGGDGNNDGMPDAAQTDVASAGVAGNVRGIQNIVTAELMPISGVCSQIENSFGLDLLQSVPIEDSYQMPFNGLHARIPDCDQVDLTIVYHGAVFDDISFGIRGYGLDFPNEDVATWHALPATGSGNAWTVTLTDGGFGDATPEDGVIVFQGGAKRLAERFFSDGIEAE